MHAFCKPIICFTEFYHSVNNRNNPHWNKYVKGKGGKIVVSCFGRWTQKLLWSIGILCTYVTPHTFDWEMKNSLMSTTLCYNNSDYVKK